MPSRIYFYCCIFNIILSLSTYLSFLLFLIPSYSFILPSGISFLLPKITLFSIYLLVVSSLSFCFFWKCLHFISILLGLKFSESFPLVSLNWNLTISTCLQCTLKSVKPSWSYGSEFPGLIPAKQE